MSRQYYRELQEKIAAESDKKLVKSLPRVRVIGEKEISTTVIIQFRATHLRIKELRNRGYTVNVIEKSRGYFDASTK